MNTPTRGIGDRTLDVVRQTSRDRQLTLWQACRELLQEKALAGRAASALQRFMELIDALAQETADMPLHVQTDRVIKDSGLRMMYEQEKGEKGQTRIENLDELVTATRQFSYNEEDEDLMPLQAFLSHAALEAGEGQADTWQDAVQLMTLHSAKGLEFPQVFIVGMEEGMFPSQMSLDETIPAISLASAYAMPSLARAPLSIWKAAASTVVCRSRSRGRGSNGWWRPMPDWKRYNFQKNIIIL